MNILPKWFLQGWNLTQSWGKCSQTIWQHSSAQVTLGGKILHPILSVCSSQSNASIYNSYFQLPLALVTLLKCLLQGSNLAKSWGICLIVGLSAQLCTSHCYRQNTQSIACKIWVFVLANQMHAFKTKIIILGTYWQFFCFLNAFSKALIWHKAEEYVLM